MNRSKKKQPGDILLEDINIKHLIDSETQKLYDACKSGNNIMALKVLKEINIPNHPYRSSISLIDYSKKFYYKKFNSNTNSVEETIIMCAYRNNLVDVIIRLLEIFNYTNIRFLFPITYEQRYGLNIKIYKGRTILMLMCQSNEKVTAQQRYIFEILLKSKNVDINLIGDDGLDAFALACQSGNITFATLLVNSYKFIQNEYNSNKFNIKTFLEKKEGFSYIKRKYEEFLIEKKFNILKENFTVNSSLMKNYIYFLKLKKYLEKSREKLNKAKKNLSSIYLFSNSRKRNENKINNLAIKYNEVEEEFNIVQNTVKLQTDEILKKLSEIEEFLVNDYYINNNKPLAREMRKIIKKIEKKDSFDEIAFLLKRFEPKKTGIYHF